MFAIQVHGSTEERRIVHIAALRAVIGRNRSCDIQLDHETVSKQHAEILQTDDSFLLRDMGSYNGTYLNDRWITETPLKRGDTIKIGRFSLVFLTDGDARYPENTSAKQAPPPPLPRPAPSPRRARTAVMIVLVVLCAIQAAVLYYVLNSPSGDNTEQTGGGTAAKQMAAETSRNAAGADEAAEPAGESAPVTPPKQDSSDTDRQPVPSAEKSPRSGSPSGRTSSSSGGSPAEGAAEPAIRPAFYLAPLDMTREKEIALRRIYLDLAGRPPTDEELAQCQDKRPAAVVRELADTDAFRRIWNDSPSKVIETVWNEKPPAFNNKEQALSTLAEWYQRKFSIRPKRKKKGAQLLSSFFVDLWRRRPQKEELNYFLRHLGDADLRENLFSLAAFFLGEVKPPASERERWIERLYIRFAMRTPTSREKELALESMDNEETFRGFLLGLAGSNEYLTY